jgi:carbonic anhydrase
MLKAYVDGYKKFRSEVFPPRRALFQSLASGQRPHTLFITCSDSRIVPDMILQTEPGQLFIVRNAGNMIPPHGGMVGGVAATVEYALAALEIRNVVVCGHSDCGAMKGVLYPEKVKDLPTVARWLRNGNAARLVTLENYPGLGEAEQLEVLIRENILAQVDNLKTHPAAAALLARGALSVHAWHYRIGTGEITAYDWEAAEFLPLDGEKVPMTLPPTRLRTERKAEAMGRPA